MVTAEAVWLPYIWSQHTAGPYYTHISLWVRTMYISGQEVLLVVAVQVSILQC
jgi:hypothetical protein